MSSKDDNDDTPATVKTIGNEIFFYGEITQESILDFTEYFKKLEIDVLKKAADMYGYTPMIRVHIMSDGGDLFAGIAAMNVLEKSRVKITTIARGRVVVLPHSCYSVGRRDLWGQTLTS